MHAWVTSSKGVQKKFPSHAFTSGDQVYNSKLREAEGATRVYYYNIIKGHSLRRACLLLIMVYWFASIGYTRYPYIYYARVVESKPQFLDT